MSEEKVENKVEVELDCKKASETMGKAFNEASETMGRALRSIMDTLDAALAGRGNTVMVRVNDEALAKLDMLVASGICSSRSEAAAFLLQRGIDSSVELFERISTVTGEITRMRDELQEWVQEGGK